MQQLFKGIFEKKEKISFTVLKLFDNFIQKNIPEI